jgi:hypothetical protein
MELRGTVSDAIVLSLAIRPALSLPNPAAEEKKRRT